MRDAFLDFAQRCDSAGFSAELVSPFRMIANIHTTWPLDDGMPPTMEKPFVIALRDLCKSLDESGEVESFGQLMNRFPSDAPWVRIFLVAELLNSAEVDDDLSVELWQTRQIRFSSVPSRTPFPILMNLFRARAIAETHQNDGYGWHIHLIRNRDRLAYRFLFDSRKSQNDLAWEKHGTGNGSLDYGDPASSILLPGTASDIYAACLRAVSGQSRLTQNRAKFMIWAAKFARPGRDAYVAHPAPKSPMNW